MLKSLSLTQALIHPEIRRRLALIGIGRLTDQPLPMVLEHGKEGSVIYIFSVIPLAESIARL
ncbi:MAG: hypothetical protein CMQ45_01420 [Gammaproteobacteria bacterium]|nr:hypothetical protein [Gammaproteobacteria bacterium]